MAPTKSQICRPCSASVILLVASAFGFAQPTLARSDTVCGPPELQFLDKKKRYTLSDFPIYFLEVDCSAKARCLFRVGHEIEPRKSVTLADGLRLVDGCPNTTRSIRALTPDEVEFRQDHGRIKFSGGSEIKCSIKVILSWPNMKFEIRPTKVIYFFEDALFPVESASGLGFSSTWGAVAKADCSFMDLVFAD